MKKIVVFANDIFHSKGAVRPLSYEIQSYGLSLYRCNVCKMFEIRERYYISEAFHNIEAADVAPVNLIQITYPSSPRGVHCLDVDKTNIFGNKRFPNSYLGWGGYPDNLYLFTEGLYLRKEEISFVAVRSSIVTRDMRVLASFQAGSAGEWTILSSFTYRISDKIEHKDITHSGCKIKDSK